MKRRSFLAGILAAGIAPAIVHNPMKIFVPKQEIEVELDFWTGKPKNLGRGLTTAIYHLDEAPFQDAFGEAFFPTIRVTPKDIGYSSSIRLIRPEELAFSKERNTQAMNRIASVQHEVRGRRWMA